VPDFGDAPVPFALGFQIRSSWSPSPFSCGVWSANKPGDIIPRHIHHGEEAFYVLQGATLETSDGKQIKLPTGAAAVNHRDVPHAGLKVVGDTPFKYLAIHVVDKGAPLYD
jgi:mannose-6-phosphate isomerase-like protein (cupin superfamily)